MVLREKKFNLIHRVLHWSIALGILFLIITVWLRSGWMSKNHIATIVQQNLTKSGYNISDKEAAEIGKEVRNSMWQWHIIVGYVLIGLYVLRMLVIAKQGIAYKNPLTVGISGKEKFKSWLYIIFYVLLAVSLITGFIIENGPKSIKQAMVFIHVKSLYYVITFIVIHIGGVLMADAGNEKGIISKMVSGDKAE